MMGKRLYKSYKNLSNIIVHISDGTEAGKAHAMLANAHLDSTLPSPGAADDALSVGVLLESARVLINTPNWSPAHAIILCEFVVNSYVNTTQAPSVFNNAEESLQDGSHLYSTQHSTAST
jgi:Zn-dependent M28 family amino/carboxypeptidase